MNKLADLKEKHKLLFSVIKLIRNRKNDDFMDLVLYGNEGVIFRNINKDVLIQQRKVLVCYLTNMKDEQELKAVLHTNIEEKYIITQYFVDKGFQIDICNCKNNYTIKKMSANEYDVIFGFGPAYQWACNKWSHALHIEYYTESPYWYSEQKEQERIKYYNERTGKNEKICRTGMFYQKNDEYNADAIVCMCEESYLKDTNVPIIKIYPHGLYNNRFIFSVNKKPCFFLFFGTAGYIHKGLDITIEAFKRKSELKLFVCGGMGQYISENGKIPDNIIDCGKVNVQSDDFLELVNECMFVILPSCAEASPSGVLTCMRHGLIPVISQGLGLDMLREYCFFLESYKIDYLENKIEEISKLDRDELCLRSKKIYQLSNEKFSLENFKKEFYSSMDKLLH